LKDSLNQGDFGQTINDPGTTEKHREIIRRKRFLRYIYEEWYGGIAERLPAVDGAVLELGSGPGFLKEFIPRIITSEVIPFPGIDMVVDAAAIPFKTSSMRAIVMVDVLHHLPDPRAFLGEANRCLAPGGAVIMVEPWVSGWSSFVYKWLHHEPFDPMAVQWETQVDGRLSGANSALPWILFKRDRPLFESEFPDLVLDPVKLIMPFRYIFSGGTSHSTLMPFWSFGFWTWLEKILDPMMEKLAMFAIITLKRK
jgi:SAM-dependent methyltransferase